MNVLIRCAPQPEELLSSFLVRSAGANALSAARLLTLLDLAELWHRDPDLWITPDELERLAPVLGVEVAQLERACLGSLVRHLGGTLDTPMHPSSVTWRGHRSGKRTRSLAQPICPVCVREHGVVLRSWRLTTTVVCARHGVGLVDRCLHCQTPIRLERSGVSWTPRSQPLRRCVHCQQVLEGLELEPWLLERVQGLQAAVWEAAWSGRTLWQGIPIEGEALQRKIEGWRPECQPFRRRFPRGAWRTPWASPPDRLLEVAELARRLQEGWQTNASRERTLKWSSRGGRWTVMEVSWSRIVR